MYRAGVDNPTLVDVLAAQPLHTQHLPAAAGRPANDALTDLLQRIVDSLEKAELPAGDAGRTFDGLLGLLIGHLIVQANRPSSPPEPATHGRQMTDPPPSVHHNLQVFLRGALCAGDRKTAHENQGP